MSIELLAIDIAKNVFQLHGNDTNGECVFNKRINRNTLNSTVANISKCMIVMESCGGSSYWYRKFTSMGHEVKLIAPKYVKPFVKTNKNDANDAEAIAEAASRPSMRFVEPKTIEQQDIQSIHRIRNRLVGNKTQLSNQIRGILLEYGIVINKGHLYLKECLPNIIADLSNELTSLTRELMQELFEEFNELDKKIKSYDTKIKLIVKSVEECQRLTEIEGIGNMTATAIISSMGNPKHFENGRHFAAYLGLVPKQSSSGQKQKLLGISKRGNRYLRTLLIHGARSAIAAAMNKSDPRSLWIQEKVKRSSYSKTSIALANKNARIAWAIIANDQKYNPNHKFEIA